LQNKAARSIGQCDGHDLILRARPKIHPASDIDRRRKIDADDPTATSAPSGSALDAGFIPINVPV